MKSLCWAFAALVVAGTAGRLPAGDKPSADNKLAPLERFAGEWSVEGKWSSGQSLHARGIYEWGLGKKILRARTYVKDGDREYQRYEGILAWHPEKKSLFEISFAFDGHITEVLIDSKDENTLQLGFKPFAPDQPANLRQVIKFLDDDHFQWTVSLKRGEEWQQLIDATWVRKGK